MLIWRTGLVCVAMLVMASSRGGGKSKKLTVRITPGDGHGRDARQGHDPGHDADECSLTVRADRKGSSVSVRRRVKRSSKLAIPARASAAAASSARPAGTRRRPSASRSSRRPIPQPAAAAARPTSATACSGCCRWTRTRSTATRSRATSAASGFSTRVPFDGGHARAGHARARAAANSHSDANSRTRSTSSRPPTRRSSPGFSGVVAAVRGGCEGADQERLQRRLGQLRAAQARRRHVRDPRAPEGDHGRRGPAGRALHAARDGRRVRAPAGRTCTTTGSRAGRSSRCHGSSRRPGSRPRASSSSPATSRPRPVRDTGADRRADRRCRRPQPTAVPRRRRPPPRRRRSASARAPPPRASPAAPRRPAATSTSRSPTSAAAATRVTCFGSTGDEGGFGGLHAQRRQRRDVGTAATTAGPAARRGWSSTGCARTTSCGDQRAAMPAPALRTLRIRPRLRSTTRTKR